MADLHEATAYLNALRSVVPFSAVTTEYNLAPDGEQVNVRILGRCDTRSQNALVAAFEITKRAQAKGIKAAFDLSRVFVLVDNDRFGYFWRIIISYNKSEGAEAFRLCDNALQAGFRRLRGPVTVTRYPLVGAQPINQNGKGAVPLTLDLADGNNDRRR